jgi:hypothetical protein
MNRLLRTDIATMGQVPDPASTSARSGRLRAGPWAGSPRGAVFSRDGRLLTLAAVNYKIPVASDVPADFIRGTLYPNSNREETIYRSKAVGEPPIMLANSVFCALADAVRALDPRAPCPRRAGDPRSGAARLRGHARKVLGVIVWGRLAEIVRGHGAAALVSVHEARGSRPATPALA